MMALITKNQNLSEPEIDKIKKFYSERKAGYIRKTLTDEELDAINGTIGLGIEDYLALAKVKKIMSDPELAKLYDKCSPTDKEHYLGLEKHWIEHEHDLLVSRFHREPTPHEFAEDFREHENGPRFKVFYCLKFPERIKIP